MKTTVVLGALAALGAPLTAANLTEPVVSPAAQLNGWYACGSDTMVKHVGAEDEAHSDAYYLETSDVSATQRRKQHGGQGQGASKLKQSKSAVALGDSDVTLPFMQQSFDWMYAQQDWHSRSATNSRHSSSRRHSKKGAASTDAPRYECGEFRVPMCYDGVCESDKTIDIFVKRVVAADGADAADKSLWILQGGPGASSIGIESLMTTMFYELDRKVNIYTMDHRGTGRSSRLECQAAEAMVYGSPSGPTISINEIPACIDDLRFQMDNQTAAYSITSAAMDLRTIIDSAMADTDVFVYGLSYGTYLVERLVHVAPESVKGFIVDGIVSETGATVEQRSTFSNWDHDVAVTADRFLADCLEDDYCKSKFPGVSNLTEFTLQLYADLDAAAKTPGTNACADALANNGVRPSYLLRTTFSDYLMSDTDRLLIPAVIYRTARCSDSDVEALEYFAEGLVYDTSADDGDVDTETLLYDSDMLYYLIVFSEMWETPTPDKATLIGWYESGVAASDNYLTLPYYCLFTGSREDACKQLVHLPPSNPLMYERDQFWNITGELRDGVTALLMTGGLDMQTRNFYGELEYEMLGGQRMLVDFEYAGHCTTFTTPTVSGGATCGVQILASFVQQDGELSQVDTSCMDDLYGLSFEGGEGDALSTFGTMDLYDA